MGKVLLAVLMALAAVVAMQIFSASDLQVGENVVLKESLTLKDWENSALPPTCHLEKGDVVKIIRIADYQWGSSEEVEVLWVQSVYDANCYGGATSNHFRRVE